MNTKFLKLNRVIFVLSLLGMVVAAYVLQSFLRQAPIICVNSGCELVRKSPLAYPFGIPMPAYGLAGYTLLAILAYLRTSLKSKLLTPLMLGISFGGVLFVSWFTYTEIFFIKAICTWCAISAVNMLVVFLLILKTKSLPTHDSK